MTRLYFCNSIYTVDPINDINPLILEKYKDVSVLVIAARDQQQKRILERHKQLIQQGKLKVVGWWDFPMIGLWTLDNKLDSKELIKFNAVVILDRNRIDQAFFPIVKEVLSLLAK
jgi:hypothetical protein